MGIRRKIPASAVALIVLAISIAAAPAASAKTARLKAFDSCGEIKDYRSDHEIALKAPFDGQFAPPVPVADEIGSNKKSKGVPGTGQASQPSDFSPTNVQETDVDEPDLVKTDGSKLYAVDGRQLHAVDVGPSGPRLLGSVRLDNTRGKEILGAAESMLISGSRALVFGRLPSGNVLITEVDITDPAAMRVVETLNLEGDFVDARLNGTVVRAVVSNSAKEGSPRSVRKDWLAGRRAEQGKIAPCGSVRHPVRFSGLDMLTVLTIDLAQGLLPVDKDTVMTSGEIVYGSPESLYIATERWMKPDAEDAQLARSATAIHKFDLEGTETVYRASGEVPGYMLSQWSMSEHEGVLRTASTTDPPFTDLRGRPGESYVSALAEFEGRLVRIGRVGKIGRGEEIYGLRFIDDMGYVITFRRIDPLYTIDLSNPRAPRVVGELKIPGFSTYLHPIGDGFLLGIGTDLSIFDVTNPSSPIRIHQVPMPGYSQAVDDHHAFLYWQPEKLAVIPVETYDTVAEPGFLGAMGFRVDPQAGIQKAGKLIQGNGSRIERTLVIRDRLYSVSETGVLSSDLKTFAPGTWVPFGP